MPLDLNNLTVIVSLLITLSIASERLVEIIKNITPFLSQTNPDTTKDGLRQAALQTLAVLAGILTTFLASPAFPGMGTGFTNSWTVILALGLLASGGSGFWNTVLKYLLAVKDAQKVETTEKQRKLAKVN